MTFFYENGLQERNMMYNEIINENVFFNLCNLNEERFEERVEIMKKLLKVMLAGIVALSLAACGSGSTTEPEETATAEPEKETVELTVWGSQDDQAMLNEMLEAFQEAHPEKDYVFTLGVVGEGDAKARYLEDPEAAADVFAFANDQLRDLVNAGGLYKVTRSSDVAAITDNNAAGTVEATKIDDQIYAFPMSADNGYFMYYDSSVFTEEDVQSFSTMLAVAGAADKKVFMDISNGWYIASFFLGNGGTLAIGDDGVQICDFNNANGLAAGEAIKAITADPAFITGDDTVLKAGFNDGSIAAGVSGTWNASDIADALGDNYAAAKLPTFTTDAGEVQMGSFAGYKFYGVNSQTDNPTDAMDVAAWLSNEENQALRFEMRKIGPSNLTVAASDEVQANAALGALAAQSEFATSQKDVLGTYWGPAEAFGTTMEAKDYSKSVQELLDSMVEQIQTAQ